MTEFSIGEIEVRAIQMARAKKELESQEAHEISDQANKDRLQFVADRILIPERNTRVKRYDIVEFLAETHKGLNLGWGLGLELRVKKLIKDNFPMIPDDLGPRVKDALPEATIEQITKEVLSEYANSGA